MVWLFASFVNLRCQVTLASSENRLLPKQNGSLGTALALLIALSLVPLQQSEIWNLPWVFRETPMPHCANIDTSSLGASRKEF